MAKETMTPSDVVFNRLYFVNLFTGDIKCNDFMAAQHHYPRLAAIAEKLTGKELQLLIDKIEAMTY